MIDLRSLIVEELEEFNRKAYLAWKRKNVSYRGIREHGEDNGAGATLGLGLYTAALSNKSMTRQYGETFFVVNAVPKNPKAFNTTNEWEIWAQNNLYSQYKTDSGFPDQREFFKHKTIEGAMQEMGFDGVVIKGREMVNYSPPDNVLYFRDESQVKSYYNLHAAPGSGHE